MTNKKIMVIGVFFALAAMLLSSGNIFSLSYAQSNTLSQSNSIDQTNDGDDGQTNTGGDDNNSNRQDYDDFQNCLEDEAGTDGFATEQQIRDCFAPIYIGGNDDSNDDNNDDSNDDNNDN